MLLESGQYQRSTKLSVGVAVGQYFQSFCKEIECSLCIEEGPLLVVYKQQMMMRQMISRIRPRRVRRTITLRKLDQGSSSAMSKLSVTLTDTLKLNLFSGRGIIANPRVRLRILIKPSTEQRNLKCWISVEPWICLKQPSRESY